MQRVRPDLIRRYDIWHQAVPGARLADHDPRSIDVLSGIAEKNLGHGASRWITQSAPNHSEVQARQLTGCNREAASVRFGSKADIRTIRETSFLQPPLYVPIWFMSMQDNEP